MPDNRKPLIYGSFPVCRNYTVRAHICDHGHLQRRGCENSVQYAGPLQCRIHSGHLHAHHQRYAKGRGGENRRLHGIGHGNHHPGTSRPAEGKPVQGDSVREGWVIVAPAPDIYQIRGGMFLKISKMLLIFPYRLDKLHRYNLDFQNGLKRMLHTCAAILPETGKMYHSSYKIQSH